MNETLLLFHAPSRPELLKIQRALLPLHIRLRCISQKDYLQPLGFLAGMKNFSPTTEVYDGEELSANTTASLTRSRTATERSTTFWRSTR